MNKLSNAIVVTVGLCYCHGNALHWRAGVRRIPTYHQTHHHSSHNPSNYLHEYMEHWRGCYSHTSLKPLLGLACVRDHIWDSASETVSSQARVRLESYKAQVWLCYELALSRCNYSSNRTIIDPILTRLSTGPQLCVNQFNLQFTHSISNFKFILLTVLCEESQKWFDRVVCKSFSKSHRINWSWWCSLAERVMARRTWRRQPEATR